MENLEKLGLFLPGSRIGVILVHGLTGTPTELKAVALRLNKYGFSVLCPQLAGHCGTEKDLLNTNWQDWTKSVDSTYAEMSKHMDVVFAGGLSAGAVLSLHLAATRQGALRGLALYSTTLTWDGWSIPKLSFLLPLLLRLPYFGKRYRFEEAFPYGIKNERLRKRIVAHMQSGDSSKAGLDNMPGLSLRELWRLVDVVKKSLPAISTPTLLIHARHDDVASVKRNSLYVQKRLGGPAELMLLDNSYHIITVDQERNTVSDASARFFHGLLNEKEKEELASFAQQNIPPALHNEDNAPREEASAAEVA